MGHVHVDSKELRIILERALHDAPVLRIAIEVGRSETTVARRLLQDGIKASPPRNKQRIRDVIDNLERRESLIGKLHNYFKKKGVNN